MQIENYRQEQRAQLKEIFFATSLRTEFKSVEEKEKFYQKYLGHYLDHYFTTTYVATESDKVLGYVTICPNTSSDLELLEINPNLHKYQDYYEEYPAHLHINLSSKSQGMGIGSKLLQYALSHLDPKLGVHLITMGSSRNVTFYRRNGLHMVAIFLDGTWLMGKKAKM